MKRVLLLYGGWKGHRPARVAKFAADRILDGLEIVCSRDLAMLRPNVLARFDLLVPIWTFDKLTPIQERALLSAVAGGMGMVCWHGGASSFLENRPHKLLLGGQFVGHLGGNHIKYSVRFLGNDPLVRQLKNFTVRSEQYYLLIDPAVKVLATTSIHGADYPWLADTRMPVAWKRHWGKGRVFYCSLGHTLDVLEHPTVTVLLRRAARWALRRNAKRKKLRGC